MVAAAGTQRITERPKDAERRRGGTRWREVTANKESCRCQLVPVLSLHSRFRPPLARLAQWWNYLRRRSGCLLVLLGGKAWHACNAANMMITPREPGGQPVPRSGQRAAARRRILSLLWLRLCWYPWSMLQPEAMLMLVVSQSCHHAATRSCAATRSHVAAGSRAVTRSLVDDP